MFKIPVPKIPGGRVFKGFGSEQYIMFPNFRDKAGLSRVRRAAQRILLTLTFTSRHGHDTGYRRVRPAFPVSHPIPSRRAQSRVRGNISPHEVRAYLERSRAVCCLQLWKGRKGWMAGCTFPEIISDGSLEVPWRNGTLRDKKAPTDPVVTVCIGRYLISSTNHWGQPKEASNQLL